MGSNFAFIGRAVDGDNRNLCLVGSQYGVGDCSRVYRVNDEYADISLEQVGNIIGLFSRIVLGINDLTLLAMVTKNGLFWVDTEKPMVTFLEAEAEPAAFLSEEPQPATEMRAAPMRAANAIFFNTCFPP